MKKICFGSSRRRGYFWIKYYLIHELKIIKQEKVEKFSQKSEDSGMFLCIKLSILNIKLKMKKTFLPILFFSLLSFYLPANHIVGGDLTIKCVGGNNFELTLKFYRDCGTHIENGQTVDNTSFDNTIVLGIYDKLTNAEYNKFTMQLSTPSNILKFGDKCYTPPDLCVDEGIYQGTLNLDNNPNGYYLSWQPCCRNGIIQNIIDPGGAALVFYMEIPDPALHNSSPVFGNYPNAYMCISHLNKKNFSCTDPDADSLVYSIIKPLNGDATPTKPGGNLAVVVSPGPYSSVQWASNYYDGNMIGGSPAMTIDSKVNYCYDLFHFKIYSRWGDPVFEANDFAFNWDGKNKNKNDLPSGIYYYVLQADFLNSKVQKQGYIHLNR